jgi:DNA-3-methyladenine glycosylase II
LRSVNNTISATVSVVPPYDFNTSIHSHRYKKYHYDRYDRSGRVYKRAFDIHGELILAEIRSAGSVMRPRLRITLTGDRIEKEDVVLVKKAIQRQFLTDLDLKIFYRGIREDAVLKAITKRFYGLKPNWPGDLFECLVRCVISQQINVVVADKIEMEFVQKFGRKIIHDSGVFYSFPTALAVSEIEIKDLRQVKFSERKADYIIGLARHIVDGKIDLSRIEKLPAHQFTEEITKIRGVGPWTAECSLMHLGHSDILPRGDIGLHHAIRKFYGMNKKAGIKKVLHVARRWNGCETLATYYLWHALTHERMNGA